MINRHTLVSLMDKPETEKLLEPSRITVKYENGSENNGLQTDMTVDVLVEPFEMKVGFREVDFFNNLNKSVQAFQAAMAEPPVVDRSSTITELDLDSALNKIKQKDLEENKVAKAVNEKRMKVKKEDVSYIPLIFNLFSL